MERRVNGRTIAPEKGFDWWMLAQVVALLAFIAGMIWFLVLVGIL